MTDDSRTQPPLATGPQPLLPSEPEPLPRWARIAGDGVTLDVHLQPGARRSAIVGEHGGRLKIALRAPPVDGRANAELLAFLAERLGVPRSALSLVAGATQRAKRIAVALGGAPAAELIARLRAG